MHAIAIDLDTGVIQIEIFGFWTPAHVEVFAADVREASQKVKQAGKRQAILYDYTEAKIQSPEVVAELQNLALENAFRSRRVALYSGSPLAKRQATRIADQGHAMRVFDDRHAALVWLTSA